VVAGPGAAGAAYRRGESKALAWATVSRLICLRHGCRLITLDYTEKLHNNAGMIFEFS
jgi:hypothetical protein